MPDHLVLNTCGPRPGDVHREFTDALDQHNRRRNVAFHQTGLCGYLTAPAFLMLALIFVCGAFGQTYSSSVGQIVEQLRSQQFASALQSTDGLLKEQPHDCRLLSLRGLALNGLQQPEPAVQSFKHALLYCPEDLLALEGAAQIEYARHQPDTLSLLKRILALRPGDATSEAMLASVYREKDRCVDALPHFEASQQLLADNTKFQEEYAFCLAKTQHFPQAAEQYQQLLARASDDTIRYNLALVQSKLHDNKEALKTLTPLLANSHNEMILALGAHLSEETGNTPQAVALLRAAILTQPQNIDNYLDFAQLAFNHHSFQVGIDMVNAGLRQLPNAPRLYVARGVLEVQLSKFPQAIADFEHAHKLQPQLSLAMDAIGMIESQQFKQTASLDLFRRQARLHPHDSLLQYLYAEALSDSDPGVATTREAVTAAKRSVTTDPGYAPAHDLLALLYLRLKQPDQALLQAQAAFRIDPTDDTALYHEIMARRELGQTARVQALVKQFAALRRNNSKEQRESHRYVLKDDVAP